MSLLSKNGGMWIDSTVFVSKPIPKKCFEIKYYSLHSNKNLFDQIIKGRWAGFLQSSYKNGNVINCLYEMLLKYWENMGKQYNYLMIDFLFTYCYEHFEFFKKDIDSIPEDISPFEYCHVLRKVFSKKYNKDEYDKLLNSAIFFKLTYKKEFKLTSNNSISNYQHFIDTNKN